MRRSSLAALLLVAGAGWAIAGALAWTLVGRVGWLGILILGVATLLVALRVELDADYPAWSRYLMRRQYEQAFEGTPEARLARWAERVERHRALYIARTIGIALALIGLNMFVRHQL
jgi:hypothetical protein